jgi:K+/H+ antiporter YhaU regulatory subunit KhtT
VIAILQPGEKRVAPLPDATLNAGDTLILEGDPHALERIVSTGKLKLESGHRVPEATQPQAEISSIEAVIAAGSPLIGLSAQASALFERFGVNLLAVSRTGERLTERLGSITLQFGDVIVLQGNLADMPERLKALHCLPVAAGDPGRRACLARGVARALERSGRQAAPQTDIRALLARRISG